MATLNQFISIIRRHYDEKWGPLERKLILDDVRKALSNIEYYLIQHKRNFNNPSARQYIKTAIDIMMRSRLGIILVWDLLTPTERDKIVRYARVLLLSTSRMEPEEVWKFLRI